MAILALLLAGSVISLAVPWVAGILTAHVLGESHPILASLPLIISAWLLLIIVKSILSFSTSYLIGSTGESMLAQLRSELYDHLQALPLRYHQEKKRGELIALIGNDAEIISFFVTGTLVRLLPLLVTFLGALVLMAWLSPQIAALCLALLPLYYFSLKLVGRRIRPISSAWVQAWSDLISFVEQNLGLIPTIKSFTREPIERESFTDFNKGLLRLSKQQLLIQSLLSPSISLLAGLGVLLLLWVGSQQVEQGQLQVPDLVSLLLYAIMLTQPLSSLADVYGQLMNARGASERILSFLAEQPEPESSHLPDLAPVRGDICFDKIRFTYTGREPLFTDFSLHISPGETIALTGVNGVGKSTLAHLLMRLADVEGGRITIDGIDIRYVNIPSLRRQIGLVEQHTLLLHGSIAENIGYGDALATQEDIENAAIGAKAHDFIKQLPQGYDTIIGDQGLKLSGGQRQRIALARALLKNPPILILDEATSMFDPEGEQDFIQESHEQLAEKTIIIITHRPAILQLADRIIDLSLH
ncbi:MAG: ABC transporter ATP-binding protein [Pseudomonadales bacterium]